MKKRGYFKFLFLFLVLSSIFLFGSQVIVGYNETNMSQYEDILEDDKDVNESVNKSEKDSSLIEDIEGIEKDDIEYQDLIPEKRELEIPIKCIVDVTDCNLGYTHLLEGYVDSDFIWNETKTRFIEQKVCVVYEEDGIISSWSLEQKDNCSIIEILESDEKKIAPELKCDSRQCYYNDYCINIGETLYFKMEKVLIIQDYGEGEEISVSSRKIIPISKSDYEMEFSMREANITSRSKEKIGYEKGFEVEKGQRNFDILREKNILIATGTHIDLDIGRIEFERILEGEDIFYFIVSEVYYDPISYEESYIDILSYKYAGRVLDENTEFNYNRLYVKETLTDPSIHLTVFKNESALYSQRYQTFNLKKAPRGVFDDETGYYYIKNYYIGGSETENFVELIIHYLNYDTGIGYYGDDEIPELFSVYCDENEGLIFNYEGDYIGMGKRFLEGENMTEYYNEMEKRASCESDNQCFLDDRCYNLGYRKSGMYCSDINLEFISQKESGEFCDNSFECKSNVCVEDSCVDARGLLEMFKLLFEWVRDLFSA